VVPGKPKHCTSLLFFFWRISFTQWIGFMPAKLILWQFGTCQIHSQFHTITSHNFFPLYIQSFSQFNSIQFNSIIPVPHELLSHDIITGLFLTFIIVLLHYLYFSVSLVCFIHMLGLLSLIPACFPFPYIVHHYKLFFTITSFDILSSFLHFFFMILQNPCIFLLFSAPVPLWWSSYVSFSTNLLVHTFSDGLFFFHFTWICDVPLIWFSRNGDM
jgi:hypothetical protein